ncbi:MAG: hypothetical protein MZV64_23615 [Ignavibacteriales bacterium]|nr:hypothetical protein [Ignavibacteriales bacterium]
MDENQNVPKVLRLKTFGTFVFYFPYLFRISRQGSIRRRNGRRRNRVSSSNQRGQVSHPHLRATEVDDSLAARVRLKGDLCIRESPHRAVTKILGCDRECGDVVNLMVQLLARHIHQHKQGFDRIRHCHEGDLCILAHEAGIGLALRGARAASRDRSRSSRRWAG